MSSLLVSAALEIRNRTDDSRGGWEEEEEGRINHTLINCPPKLTVMLFLGKHQAPEKICPKSCSVSRDTEVWEIKRPGRRNP